MPNINDINVSDAEFTAMQERATAFICERAFKFNKKFTSPESIIDDDITKKGLDKIFSIGSKNLFKLKKPIPKKSPEERYLVNFYLQHQKILNEFSDASFTVFNRDGGFMTFISNIARTNFGLSKKDAWNPADIWLIKDEGKVKKDIENEFNGPSGTQTIKELNNIMRNMYKNRQLVGLSLKLVSGNQAKYEEVNLNESYFSALETKKNEYDYDVGRIVMKFGLQTGNLFTTQDTNVIITNTSGKEIAKFQIKGNSTSGLSNLKIEGTDIGSAAARLGKAPLELIGKLTTSYGKTFENSNSNFPKNKKEFNAKGVAEKYAKMFLNVLNEKNVKVETEIKTQKEFINNVSKAFDSKQPHIANSKLMQLNFVNTLLSITPQIKREEYLTDIYFLCQKKGRSVFDFGPFGKLY